MLIGESATPVTLAAMLVIQHYMQINLDAMWVLSGADFRAASGEFYGLGKQVA